MIDGQIMKTSKMGGLGRVVALFSIALYTSSDRANSHFEPKKTVADL
jgi:hypothetical protein